MITSKTEIANLALASIGELPVVNVETDTSNPARIIRQLWPAIVREVQSDYHWRELRRDVLIASEAEQTADELYQYRLPGDFLTLVSINDNPCLRYRTEGRTIMTSAESPLRVRYTAYDENVAHWSAELTKAATWWLAARIAMPITHDIQKSEMAEAKYRNIVLPEAKRRQSADLQGQSYRPSQHGWNRTRYGGR